MRSIEYHRRELTMKETQMGKWILATVLALALGAAHAAVREEPVTYSDGQTTMKGFAVYDDATKIKRPGVLVVHEWWGITPHVHREAGNLARLGYTAFIVDLYGDGKSADNPSDAGALAGRVRNNPAVMQSRFNAARDALAKHATVDPDRIAAIGFCFGGDVVLDMTRAGSDLVAAVAFHPSLDAVLPRATPGKIKAKVLVLTGADDPFVKPEVAAQFKQEMESAKVDYRYVSYRGAVHAFTNPDATALGKQFNIPIAYNAQADQKSMAEMRKLFSKVLKK